MTCVDIPIAALVDVRRTIAELRSSGMKLTEALRSSLLDSVCVADLALAIGNLYYALDNFEASIVSVMTSLVTAPDPSLFQAEADPWLGAPPSAFEVPTKNIRRREDGR